MARLAYSALLLAAVSAHGGGLDDKPFLMRFNLALDRASNDSDNAARQASVAFAGGTSKNPAGRGFSSPGGRSSLTHMDAGSESGMRITAEAVTGSLDLGGGRLNLAYAYTDTPDGSNRYGLDSSLRSHEYFLGFARPLDGGAGAGAELRLVRAAFRHAAPLEELGGAPGRLHSDLTALDLRVGMQWPVGPHLGAGVAAGLGYGESDSTLRNLHPLPSGLPAGSLLLESDGLLRTYVLRAGLAYDPTPRARLLGDLEHVAIRVPSMGTAAVQRLLLGAEFQVTGEATLRAGWSLDSEWEKTLGVGAGFRPTDDLELALAWQRNLAPEIHPEVGRLDMFNLSLTLRL